MLSASFFTASAISAVVPFSALPAAARVLQYRLVVCRIQYVIDLGFQSFILPDDRAPYAPELRARIVCHLIFGNYASVDLVCKTFMDCQQFGDRTDHRHIRYISLEKRNDTLGCLHIVKDLQELSHRQHAALSRKRHTFLNIIKTTDR